MRRRRGSLAVGERHSPQTEELTEQSFLTTDVMPVQTGISQRKRDSRFRGNDE